ncbi:E1 ubiquitin-activating protein aos1, partial [Dimargaris xerosporica]
MAPAPNQAISKDEVALYDRQIRLWGLDSQQRLRNAHVCVVGLKTCVALELCKNLVLAGIGQLSLYDARQVEEGDQGYLYCLGAIQDSATGQQLTTVYREYLLFLNPRVQIHCQNRDPLAIQASDFAPMHLVCLVDQPGHILSQLVQLHQTTRDSNLSSPVPSHANSAPDTI